MQKFPKFVLQNCRKLCLKKAKMEKKLSKKFFKIAKRVSPKEAKMRKSSKKFPNNLTSKLTKKVKKVIFFRNQARIEKIRFTVEIRQKKVLKNSKMLITSLELTIE